MKKRVGGKAVHKGAAGRRRPGRMSGRLYETGRGSRGAEDPGKISPLFIYSRRRVRSRCEPLVAIQVARPVFRRPVSRTPDRTVMKLIKVATARGRCCCCYANWEHAKSSLRPGSTSRAPLHRSELRVGRCQAPPHNQTHDGKRENPEKTRRTSSSSATIPTCENIRSDPAGNRTRFA
ncbi:hypothetical protein PR048_003145 [Dryococelus australis]|uniref:Uncharacterized protein n=1 Tax=Dryococelus australis TaxID=614101 RepID=A0ABQ9IM70_9NEOP|nr:hypothetical protein PR048_003145 [Dryococelus australis]